MIRTIDRIKPCPKCGKHPVSVRHMGFDAARRAGLKPYAVCCGGEGCCYYVMGNTEEEAIKAWNEEALKDGKAD